MTLSLWVLLAATAASFFIGAIWYSVLFRKQWMEITGMADKTAEEMEQGKKEIGPLMLLQLVLTVVQVYVLSWVVVHMPDSSSILIALMLYVGFVLPTLIAGTMWTGIEKRLMVKQLVIQLCCQLVTFVVLGLIM